MSELIHTMVFRDGPGGGNPCPVTLDADAMTEDAMREVSARTGEEAAFLIASARPDCDLRARYFVPNGELGMCIHATIGAVTVLIQTGRIRQSPIHLETGLGPVRVDWERNGERIDVAVAQFLPEFGPEISSPEAVCRALRISEDDLGAGPIRSASTSRPKLMIPLASREVLDSLIPDFEALWDLCDTCGVSGFYPFVLAESGEEGAVCYARQFPNRSGYNEDPATGVAASALGAHLVHSGLIPVRDGWNRCRVYQGHAMGRPSVIVADTLTEQGQIRQTRVRGNAEMD